MKSLTLETIVAPITGTSKAAVATIRLSGAEAFEIASKVFAPWPQDIRPRYALFGGFPWGDSGIALPFVQGASFTGEETVELSVHGGKASVGALLDSCVGAGARMAVPGEFSLRAFMNGRIDLSQAEAIADLVEAQTDRQLKLAATNLNGGLKGRVNTILERIVAHVALLEASIDFSEEVGEYDFEEAQAEIYAIGEALASLEEEGRRAHIARRGIRVALVGLPNSGKSSLFNALLKRDRAIVTDMPGTTRDTLEESLLVEGLELVLTDTAGIRGVADQIEQLGIKRTMEAAEMSDEILYVFDAQKGWSGEDEKALAMLTAAPIVVGNKADLASPDRGLAVSAVNQTGMGGLIDELKGRVGNVEDIPPINDRQAVYIAAARLAVQEAEQAARAQQPPDLIGVLLGSAKDDLGKITGATVSEDMLAEIFGRFCIGK